MSLSESTINEIKQRFEIVGRDKKLNRAIEIAAKVAPTELSVLVTGESGVGKEAFSKIIHALSKRKHNGFIAINAGAIPEGTIDSELFGHEKGSFTSAHDSRKGYFETMNGGTLFLDEIGELPLGTQSRLLRVLESGEFLRVGSSKVMKTDVRIIAATNRDLVERIEKNKFREDLYYRLNTVNIQIPSLRERKEDIMFLFAKFATDFADKYDIPPISLTDDAIELLINFDWPGNIRQLKNFVEELSVLETERNISAATIEKYIPKSPGKSLALYNKRSGTSSDSDSQSGNNELLYKLFMDLKKDLSEMKTMLFQILNSTRGQAPQNVPDELIEPWKKLIAETGKESFAEAEEYRDDQEEDPQSLSLQDQEREMIKKALIKHSGRRKSAAKELGISERTLYRKIKEYELESI